MKLKDIVGIKEFCGIIGMPERNSRLVREWCKKEQVNCKFSGNWIIDLSGEKTKTKMKEYKQKADK